MLDQWSFIERVAERIGVTEEAFRKWRVRGVPAKQRLAIVDAANAQGFDLDREVFDRPPGPKSKKNGSACE